MSETLLQEGEAAAIATAGTITADVAEKKPPLAIASDAAATAEAGFADRIAALEAHSPVIASILGFLQSMFPHSTVATVAMPAPAGSTAPTTPQPTPTWNGQAWVIPTAPSGPPPTPTWNAATGAWEL